MMMESTFLSVLPRWANFYVIVGSSAGALTGLQFVVIALIAQSGGPTNRREIRAFGTPTVIHFCAALMISVVMNIPWLAVSHLVACVGALAMIGSIYSLTVILHTRKPAGYQPDAEDWFWYAGLPLLAYVMLGVVTILAWSLAVWSLFVIAAISVLFLFLGIRNSWDTVIYVALQRAQRTGEQDTAPLARPPVT
jgi:hypothetical protein